MPLTVIPFFAYVFAIQWTMPWRADLAELIVVVTLVYFSNFPENQACDTHA
jgi:hypothetical protein